MPSSIIEKLLKILKLEIELGYENKAVVGGLDKYIPTWVNEAQAVNIDIKIVEDVSSRLGEYRGLAPNQRPEAVKTIQDLVRTAVATYRPPRPPQQPRPEPKPGEAAGTPPLARPERRPSSPGRPDARPPQPAGAEKRTPPPRPESRVQAPRPENRPQPAARPERQATPPARDEEGIQSEERPATPAQVEDFAGAQPQPSAPPPPARPRPAPPAEPRPQPPVGLNAPLTVLQGIGPKNAELLQTVNLRTLEDLLYYFPRRYDDYSQLKTINHLTYGDELTIIGTVQTIATRPVRGGQMQITEALLTDGTGFLKITWYNQPWLATKIPSGTQLVLSGKIDMHLGRLVMNSPDWEYLEQEHLHTNRIVPVYPLSGRITQRQLRKLMHQTVSYWVPRLQDYIPESILRSAGLPGLMEALTQVHFPESQKQLEMARARLAFDEIFMLQLGVLRQKRAWQSQAARVFSVSEEWLENQSSLLPYTLTGAQQKVLQALRSDLASGRPMNRLLQGDVGSGKTVVAALAAAIVLENGAQVAIMAPTGILAEQHFRTFSALLEKGGLVQPGEVRLLVSDTPDAEKSAIREGLADGSIRLVTGTHALLEDPVTFKQLQLTVIDEQHRFGVAQRAILRAKGENPHLLVMTATPIPRSLALTLYGDLDLAVMDEMPVGRLPVKTHALHPLERERAYQLIRSQVEQNHQAFIIYPLVEQGEKEETKAAVEEHARLKAEIFRTYNLGLLHGRMRPEDKENVMRRFRDGEFQILISTSVVEVGVDVPNATVMLIEGANRFGLAQLHQFRGRVGRGPEQSYCLLIPETENAVENERLSAMEESTDGFVLAERDLQQRGPGDFLGTRQSGFAELRMANLSDVRLIEKARQQASAYYEQNPDFGEDKTSALFQKFQGFWRLGQGDLS